MVYLDVHGAAQTLTPYSLAFFAILVSDVVPSGAIRMRCSVSPAPLVESQRKAAFLSVMEPAHAEAAPKPLMRWYSLPISTLIVAALARVPKNATKPAKKGNPLIENDIKPPIRTLLTIK